MMPGSTPPGDPAGDDALPANIHGSAVLIGSCGILVRGSARSGKSALCLSSLRRAASLGLSPMLVADDRVVVTRASAGLLLSAPPVLKNLLEVSGVGIVEEPAVDAAPLSLVVDLADEAAIERLPEAAALRLDLWGVEVRRVVLPRREAAYGADVLVSLAMGMRPLDL